VYKKKRAQAHGDAQAHTHTHVHTCTRARTQAFTYKHTQTHTCTITHLQAGGPGQAACRGQRLAGSGAAAAAAWPAAAAAARRARRAPAARNLLRHSVTQSQGAQLREHPGRSLCMWPDVWCQVGVNGQAVCVHARTWAWVGASRACNASKAAVRVGASMGRGGLLYMVSGVTPCLVFPWSSVDQCCWVSSFFTVCSTSSSWAS